MGAISYMGDMIGATPPIDDSSVSDKKLWSSQKVDTELSNIVSGIQYIKCTSLTTSIPSSSTSTVVGNIQLKANKNYIITVNARWASTVANVSGAAFLYLTQSPYRLASMQTADIMRYQGGLTLSSVFKPSVDMYCSFAILQTSGDTQELIDVVFTALEIDI